MSELLIYGVKTCETCRKLLRKLVADGTPHRFIDLRATPVTPEQIERWAAVIGWERLVNRNGTTWRQLPETRKQAESPAEWLKLALEFPTLLKRPLVVSGDQVSIGLPA